MGRARLRLRGLYVGRKDDTMERGPMAGVDRAAVREGPLMKRDFLTMTYYIEIGTAAELIALHGSVDGAAGDGSGGVEIVSGWASDDPYQSIAVDVAHERGGEHEWVVLWTDTAGRGKAPKAL